MKKNLAINEIAKGLRFRRESSGTVVGLEYGKSGAS
jgi:hypothetical protein